MRENGGNAVLLSVLDGVHKGASVRSDGPVLLIGSAPSCDILVSDAAVAGQHLTLHIDGTEVLVEAKGGPVILNGQTTVEIGARARLRLPVELGFGGIRAGLAWEGGARNRSMLPPKLLWAAAALVSVASAVAVQASGAFEPTDRPQPELPKLAAQVNAVSGLGMDAGAALSARLHQAGMDTLKVTADGSRVTVSGDLPATRISEWRDIQTWFDRTFGSLHVLESKVGAAAERVEPRFDFQAVWFGARPYAIGSDGARLYEGAALEGGWVIKDISDGRLTVRRGNEDFVLTF